MNTPECTCPPEHSITKLGHNRECPHFARFLAVAERHHLSEFGGNEFDAYFICGRDKHEDGQPHDFGWATYSDTQMSTGVCKCGLSSFDFILLRAE